MNLSFLNPINWIKRGVASQFDRTVDELLTAFRGDDDLVVAHGVAAPCPVVS